MSAAPLPRPLAAAGAVTIDAAERTLVVKPAKDADGYARLLWRAGHRAQVKDAKTWMGGSAPTVWANGGGGTKIAYGLPSDDGTVRFRFSRGDPVYKKLVGTPGLRATFVVDRGSSQILGVRFHGR